MASVSSRSSGAVTEKVQSPLTSPTERMSSRKRDSNRSSSQSTSNDSQQRRSRVDEDDSIDFVGEEEYDEDEEYGNNSRRSTQSQSFRDRKRSSSMPMSPPSVGSDDDYYQNESEREIRSENVLGRWHFAPLLVALVPPLGAVLGGGADAWSDAILLFIASFYLYQLLKVPHDIYHSARTRRVLHGDAEQESTSDMTEEDHALYQEQRRQKLLAAAELRKAELISLAALVLSPVAGAWLLTWLMETFTDGSRYLNTFNIRLFMLASGIKPWSHAISLFRKRLLHLQEVVHYPSSRVESMNRRLATLEGNVSSLRKLVALKSDVSMLRDGIDLPLTQLSRTMRRYEKKEEHLRMSAEDKFSLMESRLEDLLREVAINAELIEEERRQRTRVLSLPASILHAIKYALGQNTQREYHYDRNLTGMTAPLNITAPPSGPEHTPNSKISASAMQQTHSADSLPDYSSPPRYPSSRGKQLPSASPLSNATAALSPDWMEQGLAYWLFLPINVPKAVLRSAFSYTDNRVTEAKEQGYVQSYANMAGSGPIVAAVNIEKQAKLASNKARYVSPIDTVGTPTSRSKGQNAASASFARRG